MELDGSAVLPDAGAWRETVAILALSAGGLWAPSPDRPDRLGRLWEMLRQIDGLRRGSPRARG